MCSSDLVNKEDLESNITEKELQRLFPDDIIIKASVKEETGLNDLTDCIAEIAVEGEIGHNQLEIMLNIRQKQAFRKVQNHINEARRAAGVITYDCLAVDLSIALEALGELTGKNSKEEVLDRIFRDFCIGK